MKKKALDVIVEAIKKAGYEPGKEIALGIRYSKYRNVWKNAQKIGK